jgi:hypothetical protein
MRSIGPTQITATFQLPAGGRIVSPRLWGVLFKLFKLYATFERAEAKLKKYLIPIIQNTKRAHSGPETTHSGSRYGLRHRAQGAGSRSRGPYIVPSAFGIWLWLRLAPSTCHLALSTTSQTTCHTAPRPTAAMRGARPWPGRRQRSSLLFWVRPTSHPPRYHVLNVLPPSPQPTTHNSQPGNPHRSTTNNELKCIVPIGLLGFRLGHMAPFMCVNSTKCGSTHLGSGFRG